MLRDRLNCYNPIRYRGPHGLDAYYERWYFKQTAWGPLSGKAGRKERAIIFLPGVSYAPDGNRAFIQTFDGASGASRCFLFPISEFSLRENPFEIRIGDNRFSLAGINLDLVDEQGHLGAAIQYGKATPPRRLPWSPGVLGLNAFSRRMGSHYEIASLDHSTEGFAWIKDDAAVGPPDPIIFNGGRGYIAKSWGSAMPEARLWLQANDFDRTLGDGSFALSLARIKVGRLTVNGLVCLLLIDGKEYRFTSRTGARVDLLEFDGPAIHILLSDRSYKMEIQVRRFREGNLATQPNGELDSHVLVSADARTRILLKRRHGTSDALIFDSSSPAGAIEIAGDLETLKP